jgi:hypothetical protein
MHRSNLGPAHSAGRRWAANAAGFAAVAAFWGLLLVTLLAKQP